MWGVVLSLSLSFCLSLSLSHTHTHTHKHTLVSLSGLEVRGTSGGWIAMPRNSKASPSPATFRRLAPRSALDKKRFQAALEQIEDLSDSQGQILALAFR